MRIIRTVVVIVVGLTLSCAFVGTGQASGTPPQPARSMHQVVFLSDPEYSIFKEHLAVEAARHRSFSEAVNDGIEAAKGGGTIMRERRAPGGDPWFIMSDQKDRTGADVPARRGIRGTGNNFNGGFGYAKYSEKHNVTSLRVVSAVITSGTKVQMPGYPGPNYEGHMVGQAPNGTYVDEKIVVGTDMGRYLYALRQNSPDGKPVGVVTVYCATKVRCPSEVNDFEASAYLS